MDFEDGRFIKSGGIAFNEFVMTKAKVPENNITVKCDALYENTIGIVQEKFLVGIYSTAYVVRYKFLLNDIKMKGKSISKECACKVLEEEFLKWKKST